MSERKKKEVDEAIASTDNRISKKFINARDRGLVKLFNNQLKILRDRECPPIILEMLLLQRQEITEKAGEMAFKQGYIPFLPVIPRTYLTIYSQMLMVRNGHKVGYTDLDAEEITDVIEIPDKPYYIFDVENGTTMAGKHASDAEELIKDQNRRCLTDVEVISLGIQTDVLFKDGGLYVDATSSRYKSSEMVPDLCCDVSKDYTPTLSCRSIYNTHGKWGSASCAISEIKKSFFSKK